MTAFAMSRRLFMGASSVIAVTAAADADTDPATARAKPANDEVTARVPIVFDRDAFHAVMTRPFPHRQVTAPQTFSEATVAMSHFRNALAAYADPNGFAAGAKSLHCAAVLYAGRSLAFGFTDAMYAKYPLGLLCDEEARPSDTRYRAFWTSLKKNPQAEFYQPLADQGVSVFVCNNALSGLSVELAARTGAPGTTFSRERVVAIHNDLMQNLVQGAMVVPAGVGAMIALQESGFTYLP